MLDYKTELSRMSIKLVNSSNRKGVTWQTTSHLLTYKITVYSSSFASSASCSSMSFVCKSFGTNS